MGYSVYYNGEIDISPELSDEHAALLDEALTKSNPALLGITAEDGQGLYHGCDWQLSGGRLSVEGESRGEQDEWLRLLIVRFFQPNVYTLSGEVSWEGDQSADTGVIHLDDNRVESVSDSIAKRGRSGVHNFPSRKWWNWSGRDASCWRTGRAATWPRRFNASLVHFRNSCSFPMKAEVDGGRTLCPGRRREIAVSPGWAPCALPATEGSLEGPGASPFQFQLI